VTHHAQVLEHQVVYQGRVFDVHRDRVRLSSGDAVTMEVVRHRGSVVLLPVLDDGRLVLIRQYRYSIDRWIWELPAGRIERGEEPEAAARRECQEEIGFTPRGVDLLAEFYPTPGFCDEVMKFYRLGGLEKLPPDSPAFARDPDEQLEVRIVALQDVRAMVGAGDIVDLKTAVGISLLRTP
jgi:ADP-ribose pyrophosphatase